MILTKCKRVICLNAGHHLKDAGSCISLPNSMVISENSEVMKIRDLLVPLLREAGFEVITIPDNLNLVDSIDLANSYLKNLNDGFCLDIHLNSKGISALGYVSGVECYTGSSKTSRSIGEALSSELSKEISLPNRGWRPGSSSAIGSLGWLWKINSWSAVLECLYLDSDIDVQLLLTGQHKKIAQGICNGIKKLFGVGEIITSPVAEVKAELMKRLVELLNQLRNLLTNIRTQKLGNMNISLLKSSLNEERWSLTIKALVGAAILVLKGLFGLNIISEEADRITDAVLTF